MHLVHATDTMQSCNKQDKFLISFLSLIMILTSAITSGNIITNWNDFLYISGT